MRYKLASSFPSRSKKPAWDYILDEESLYNCMVFYEDIVKLGATSPKMRQISPGDLYIDSRDGSQRKADLHFSHFYSDKEHKWVEFFLQPWFFTRFIRGVQFQQDSR